MILLPVRITFLIGNGFDRNLNMKTSYIQFYENCLLQYKSENPIVDDIKAVYKSESEKNKDLWSDLEKALGQYVPSSKVSDVDFIESSNEITLQLQNYLKEEQEKLSIENEEALIQQMYNAIGHFYDIGNNLTPNESEKIKRNIYRITAGIQFSAISFNYTSAFDMCFGLLKNSGLKIKHKHGRDVFEDIFDEVFHVHGEINDGVILGVDNVEQIKNPEWKKNLDVQSTLIKTRANESWGYNRTNTAERMIDESIIICVYGLSLGETDQTWWRKIYQWLSIDSSRILVLALHKLPKQNRLLTNNERVLMNRRGRETFMKAANINDNDWSRIRNQVIICQNPNWFDLDIKYLETDDNNQM